MISRALRPHFKLTLWTWKICGPRGSLKNRRGLQMDDDVWDPLMEDEDEDEEW